MGLDMYLYKKTYVRNWDFMTPEEKNIITIKRNGVERTDIKPERISEITENVGQWRKFNALHNWFVQNLADGVDDCKELYVERKALEGLLDTLKKVKRILNKAEKKSVPVHVGWKNGKEFYENMDVYDISDKIEKLLPTASGFFFGGTEYDEYYYNDVCDTIKLFTELLKEEGDGDFYYQASW